ncbi:MAG: GNAT family N-acetyltransferase, partial [Flavobacteriales bacterium]|nr:GNAT family N-acetyltransferase [Flavobacteriales bacterium]
MTIRDARPQDIASILEIYRPFITDTAVTFETEIPALSDFEERISKVQETMPW